MTENEELLFAALRSAPAVSGVPDPRYIEGAERGSLRVKIRCGNCQRLLAEIYDYEFVAHEQRRPVLHSMISGRNDLSLTAPACPAHPRSGPIADDLERNVETARARGKPVTRRV